MTSDRESEIKSCLAYQVLQNPDPWIGGPSTIYLQSFLCGAQIRRDYVGSSFPEWRISGVLDLPEFYMSFVEATGRPKLTIRWASAIQMTHFSFAEGFNKLRNDALQWHRTHGIDADQLDHTEVDDEPTTDEIRTFWNTFGRRPAMYFGNDSGWGLYCFLNGMLKGGDWLGLPEMPDLDRIFNEITRRSEKAYGSPFAAFREYRAQGLLEWVGLPENDLSES